LPNKEPTWYNMPMSEYICLIADIVRSKEISNRSEFQKLLKDKLIEISKRSKKYIVSPYVITTGDEFQAVYKSYDSIFIDIFEILWTLFPKKVRFAISYGDLVTEINKQKAIGMDGPAFYKAREQIEIMKKKEKFQREKPDTSMIMFYGYTNNNLYLINKSLKMFFIEYNKWNKTAITSFFWLLKKYNKKDIADNAHVSNRMVYKSIKMNYINEYVDYFEKLPCLLNGKEI
jgi:SatD family (SatD)